MEGNGSEVYQILFSEQQNKGKFILQSKFLKYLLLDEEVKERKIVSIPICGAVGTGKSFILNFLLRYLKAQYIQHNSTKWLGEKDDPLIGFIWRDDIDPVTQGICIWSEVFLYDSPSGEQYAILLMDTQGIIGSKFTIAQDLTIMAASTKLSSIMIYNVYKSFSFTDLTQFQVLTDFFRYNGKNDDGAQFPDVLVLVRDFESTKSSYGLKTGREIESNSHLKSLTILLEYFANVKSYSLCYPKCDIEDNDFFDGSYGMLNPKFVTLLEQLPRMILSPEVIETSKWFTTEGFLNSFETIISDVNRYIDHLAALKTVADSKNLYLEEMKKTIEMAIEAETSEETKQEPKNFTFYKNKMFSLLKRKESNTTDNTLDD